MSVNGYDGQNLIEYASRTAVDAEPTEGSVRPVSSNGVFEALEGKADIVDLGTYNSGTYPTDTDFVNGIVSYIKSHFGNDRNGYANIKYIRGGSWVGTMEYSPYQNGYISILAHYYQTGMVVHFGTTNGVPFYEHIAIGGWKRIHTGNTIQRTFTNGFYHFTASDVDNVDLTKEVIYETRCAMPDNHSMIATSRWDGNGFNLFIPSNPSYTGTASFLIDGLVAPRP